MNQHIYPTNAADNITEASSSKIPGIKWILVKLAGERIPFKLMSIQVVGNQGYSRSVPAG
jgi:hypothetical protein